MQVGWVGWYVNGDGQGERLDVREDSANQAWECQCSAVLHGSQDGERACGERHGCTPFWGGDRGQT